jgi:aspartate/methionine/tyrosine aminotransferase
MTAFARRISNVKPEGAYEVLAQAQQLERQGRDIIHLEIGQPDFQTFDAICQSGKDAIDAGQTRYSPSAGVGERREAIARRVSATKGPCAPGQVVVGPGAKPGILFPRPALVNPGDEVLYPKVSPLTMHPVGCTEGFTQMAGIAALKRCSKDVEAQRALYQGRSVESSRRGLRSDAGDVLAPDTLSIFVRSCREHA